MVCGRALEEEELACLAQQDKEILERSSNPGSSTENTIYRSRELLTENRQDQRVEKNPTESFRGELKVCGRALESKEIVSLAQHDKELAWMVHSTRESCNWSDNTSSTYRSSRDRSPSSPMHGRPLRHMRPLSHLRPRRLAVYGHSASTSGFGSCSLFTSWLAALKYVRCGESLVMATKVYHVYMNEYTKQQRLHVCYIILYYTCTVCCLLFPSNIFYCAVEHNKQPFP